MKQEHHLLNQRYRQLLQRQFRTRFPEQLPGLTLSVEPSTRACRILHWYDERGRAKDKKPITCCFGHKHGRGFVVELEDGRVVLVGRDCAKKDFGFEFDDVVKGFEHERDLQFQVRRLIAVRQALPAAKAELLRLASDTRFDSFWQTLMRRYGKASLRLAAGVRSTRGTLVGVRQERDREAEASAAKKANPYLFDAYEAAATTEERRIATARIEKYINSCGAIYKNVEFPMGPCDGWRLLDGTSRPVMANLFSKAVATLERADNGKAIEHWSKTDFAQLRRDLDEFFLTIQQARDAVVDLLRFASLANRERIAGWAMQCALEIEISLPDGYGWPATPALDALREARSGSAPDEALAA